MDDDARRRYYLVDASVLPETFLRVADAKRLLETGAARTVAEAAERAGISRSAFYKYRDAITPFTDLGRSRIITFHILLRDRKGALSALLALFSGTGANILTINQSIPTNGTAVVAISAQTGGMQQTVDQLLQSLEQEPDVIRVEVPAG